MALGFLDLGMLANERIVGESPWQDVSAPDAAAPH